MSPPLHPTTVEEFDAILAQHIYVIVDFTASWCPPCRAIAPVFESLSAKHSLPEHLAFVKVDVDELPDIAQRYNIAAMPTFRFLKEGKQVAVHGDIEIKGANPPALTRAAEKIGALAKAKAEGVESPA